MVDVTPTTTADDSGRAQALTGSELLDQIMARTEKITGGVMTYLQGSVSGCEAMIHCLERPLLDGVKVITGEILGVHASGQDTANLSASHGTPSLS